MHTIQMAFVPASFNNLEVCVVEISTAFLYGHIHEKVYVIAGKEFCKQVGKQMIIDGDL